MKLDMRAENLARFVQSLEKHPGDEVAELRIRRLAAAPMLALARLTTPLPLILLLLLALALPNRALAQEMPRLQEQITDLSRDRVLAPGRMRIEQSLAELLQTHDIQLFVLFVESTGGRPVTSFADEVARRSSLGANDALLVVALRDRSDALWRGSRSLARLTDRELEAVLSQRVEPLLARGDFVGAVVASVDGIAAIAGAGETSPAAPTAGLALSPLLLALVAGLGGLWLWGAVSAGKRRQQMQQEQEQQTEQLAEEANALLIRTDEAVRDAREEIGFAEAQFGEPEVATYREAVAQASDELKAAFAVRQQLDDAVPETPETRRRLLTAIVERARRAQALLEQEQQRVEQLRDLERTAPEVLAAMPAQLDALEARVPEAERTLGALERYAAASWASVADNLIGARERLSQGREAVAAGQGALEKGDRAGAGRAARAAQQAAAETARLLEAIGALARSLQQAEQAARPQLAAAAADVASARRALVGGGGAELARRIAEAESLLQQAEQALQAERPDYLTGMRLAAQADALADQILVEVKQEEERQERETRILATQLQSAETSFYRAADFIAARRQVIGSAARTRLMEAERRLDRANALAADDPRAALAEARRAEVLAEEAYALAQDNLAPYGSAGGFFGFPRGAVIAMPFPAGGGFGGAFGRGGGLGGGFGGGSVGGGSVGGRW